jgi:hypothetical protein
MKYKLIVVMIILSVQSYAQDVITWSTARNGTKVADTVALEDYVPVKDGVIYQDVIIEAPGINKKELFSRAKLAVQKVFSGNKIGSSNYDDENGIVSINNFYEIQDMTALSALSSDPTRESYNFNAILSVLVKDGKYKIKMEISGYTFGVMSRYASYSDFQTNVLPVSSLANDKQNMKRQRMRVLKTLNEKMLATFNLVKNEMKKKLDTDF